MQRADRRIRRLCSSYQLSVDLENDEEELQGKQSINYMGLHRNMKHRGKASKRIVCIRLGLVMMRA